MGAKLALRAALVAILLVSGCTAQPETGPPAAAFTGTDVMYLQMGITQIAEGSSITALATERATDPRLKALAAELQAQWQEELAQMQRWLLGWSQPLTAPSTSHEGHGSLHMLRPSDIAELRSSPDFDRTAVSLLLGHLGNVVETARMETTSGAYPPARHLAETVTARRQSQIQTLLTLPATP
ncbi:DUF305 domain-containing protein [Paractinoplanes atraurantiacus]|uniref:Uncharacterized conserved protein, DUF305 family n=1 Tax=Paractinoplanes atraurantiacus TaxID=1036182 RepID=A0A285HXH0_9ACTN|nr:DUF305 domain-containing protein [Actinoplanes atraurantiacus]SNY40410.1 Uncharacterized conserved protein, DUF305 family [Actinoplanes atraurantiacus]